jgi:dTMP kinase
MAEGPPYFVTFEGLDGSGKTSHLRAVASRLETAGVPHRVTHEPGGTPLGEAVRRVFLDHRWSGMDGTVELLLVFASRRQHLLEVIDPALDRGEHVLCDRFTDSTRAYQGVGRALGRERVDAVDAAATGGRTPDRTLLFDLPAEVARERGAGPREDPRKGGEAAEADRLDREALGFYRRVRDGFLALADAEPERFRVIDSSGDPERTAAQVTAALADLFPELTTPTGSVRGAR